MDNKKFGTFLASQRRAKGWTQAELAQKLNVTDKAVSKWECGLGFPDIKLLEPLAGVLGVSVLELMHGERITQPEIPAAKAEQALSDAIGTAALQRKIERKNLALICGCACAAVMLVFLVDNMTWYGFFFVCLPVAALLAGGTLLVLGLYRRRQGQAYRLALTLDLVMLLYPLLMFLLLFFAFALGGPAQG